MLYKNLKFLLYKMIVYLFVWLSERDIIFLYKERKKQIIWTRTGDSAILCNKEWKYYTQ